MARGFQQFIACGNLGADPEVRSTRGGETVASFRVATSESWKDKATGEKQERTEWHSCVAFGRLGEIVVEYATKGRQVLVAGKLRTEEYTDREGVKRYATKLIVDEFQLLGSRESGGGEHRGSSGPRNAPAQREPRQQPAATAGGEFIDDEIPF